MRRVDITVQGLVQGVGFRYHTRQEAMRLGVSGYVRNRPDGAVDIVAEGDDDAVQHLIAWAQQGPAAARVSQVDVVEQSPLGNFKRFSIES
ncbi:Acylphosphatase [Halomicronema hongdechloris C2206]|uniref:Acylphosphatase n=1 Tax=Halomicronema hongdechloris C2206 TaxID=1641165 RepID=A0A1Z3HUT6_9CYAN|nr:acylphosphatase [Halomicronema hongdechloris]ASC74080.1 Acylphosphatase [Halomicronema hongdechloris C2206]